MYVSLISLTPSWARVLSYAALWRLYHFQFLSSDANSKKSSCKTHGLPPPARRDFLLAPRPTQSGQGIPVIISWYRDYTAKSGQQVRRRKACVVNIAEKRYGVGMRDFPWRPLSRKTLWNLARMQGFLTAKTASGSLLSIWAETLLLCLTYISRDVR